MVRMGHLQYAVCFPPRNRMIVGTQHYPAVISQQRHPAKAQVLPVNARHSSLRWDSFFRSVRHGPY